MKKLFEYFTDKSGGEKEPTHPRPKTDDSLNHLGPNKIDTKGTSQRLAPVNKGPADNLYDSLAFVIYCPKHNNIAVSTTEHIGGIGSSAVWLPFIYLSPIIGWAEAMTDGLALILSDNDSQLMHQFKRDQPWDVCVLHVLRIQLPHTQRYITRIICLARLKKCKDRCQQTSRLTWVNLNNIRNMPNMWAQEIKSSSKKVNIEMSDYESYQTVAEEDLDSTLKYVPRSPPRSEEEEMLRILRISEKQVERVFVDFLEHCFPAHLMSFHSFKNYFRKYKFISNDSRMSQYFAAFNFSDTGFVNFHELLLGMACIEPDVFNGSSRIKFIFRFYDTDKDGFFNDTELLALIKDLNPGVNGEALHEKRSEAMRVLTSSNNRITYKSFSTAVGTHRFRGTSTLCRAPRSLFNAISNAMAQKGVKANPELKKTVSKFMNTKIYDGVCSNCKKTDYQLSTHWVTLGVDGKYNDFKEHKEYNEIAKKQSSQQSKVPHLSDKYSIDVKFNVRSLPNFLRQEIQAFNEVKGNRDNPKGLFAETKETRERFAKMLEQLANDIIPILESEDRCVKVRAPAYVIGDIHGNLEDLLSIEKYLFKSVPIVTANYVFLGDYVDRGKWSVECALYVLCLKLLAPNNFHLLRGNHETRVLNELYSFKREIGQKYRTVSDQIYNTFNRIFDYLPFAAVIDSSIFCCHGGIPTHASTINELDRINTQLSNVQDESPVAWEILWNDPVDMKEFLQTCDFLQKREDIYTRGFVTNKRRGTAYYFNESACQEFLRINGLSHIIRAHEVPAKGYRFHFEQRCMTIFSCSHYCGNDNRAAVAHVSDQTIRILELDTQNNLPATDDGRQRL